MIDLNAAIRPYTADSVSFTFETADICNTIKYSAHVVTGAMVRVFWEKQNQYDTGETFYTIGQADECLEDGRWIVTSLGEEPLSSAESIAREELIQRLATSTLEYLHSQACDKTVKSVVYAMMDKI
jgi:hypothetical protein